MKGTIVTGTTIIELITGLGLGGAERLVLELTQELVSRGENIQIISLTSDTRILSQYPKFISPPTILNATQNPFSWIRPLLHLLKVTAKSQKIVIHAHMFHALLAAIAVKIFRPRLQIVFTSHNYGGFSILRKIFVKATRSLRSADIIFDKDQHCEMNATNTFVIPNFAPRIPPSEHIYRKSTKTKKDFVFAFIGRMTEVKNPLAIIVAFQNLSSKHGKLLIVGDGPLEEAAKSYVISNQLAPQVEVLGPRNDVASILEKVDVLVMASKWEGLPMVILEAGSRGITVIAPPVGAIPSLLDDECGYLCQPIDLSKAMSKVIADPEEAALRGRRLQSRIQSYYSVEISSLKHLDIYRQA